MTYKGNVKFRKEELAKFIIWIRGYISYRGGMGNRIDAFDIEDKLIGKLKYLKQKRR